MITPLEIRQHSFNRALRGFEVEEVRNYLGALSQEFEQLQDENKRLKQELDRAQASLKGYQEVESILHKTLLQAEQSSKATLENARRDADVKVQSAEQQAQAIVAEAREQRARIESEIADLVKRRNEFLLQLSGLLNNQLERLRLFEQHEMSAPAAAPKPAAAPPADATRPAPMHPSADASFFDQVLRERPAGLPDTIQDIARKL